jgi:hypothetical protein
MDGEPDPRFYRFSVKCDRAQNHDIEKRAKAAGMSPTALVQKHFETIFFEPGVPVSAPVEVEAEPAPALPLELPMAPIHDDDDFDQPAVPVKTSDKVIATLKRHATNGIVAISYRDIGAEVGASQETVRHHVQRLIDRKVISLSRPGSRGTIAIYRIPGEQ